MAKTLLHWTDDHGPGTLFLMPPELLEPYRDAKGYYINTEPHDEKKCQMIEHLAWMLGTEPHEGEIPTLEKHLADNAHKLEKPQTVGDEEKEKLGLAEEEWEERKKKLGKGPWSQYQVKPPYLIQDVVIEVFHAGWYC